MAKFKVQGSTFKVKGLKGLWVIELRVRELRVLNPTNSKYGYREI